jgi:putative transposase
MNASKRMSTKDRARDSVEGPPEEIRDRLAGLLPQGALDDALEGLTPEEITGSGGLLTQLAGRVIEAALAGELSEHLGYPPGTAPPGGSAGNMRNGGTPKTVHTDIGSVRIQTPRDRDGSFEPRLVAKRQTRLAGLDDKVLDLYGGGMSTRDIADHRTRLYGTPVGRDTISRITASVLQDIAAWRNRPLDAVYPIVYFDAMRVKVREDRSVQDRACYLAVGVTVDGERDLVARPRRRDLLARRSQRPQTARRRRRADRLRRHPPGRERPGTAASADARSRAARHAPSTHPSTCDSP